MPDEVFDRGKERALEKIKKCLALSESDNSNEAEAALRQARKLMEKYRLEMTDIESSRAQEFELRVGKSTRQSAQWVRLLGTVVARAMGCICFFRHGALGQSLIFIGGEGSGELAAYAYAVLSRQLVHSRKKYLSELPDYGKAYKRKMGTLYGEGWIRGIALKVEQFGGMDERIERAVKAYCEKKYPDVGDTEFKRRRVSEHEYRASLMDEADGGRVELHSPMSREESLLLS